MNRGNFWRVFLAAGLALPQLSILAAETATIRGENTLVRSQPTRFSPSIAKLQPGDAVTVLEEISLEKPAPNDELRWLKIECPTNATGWVHGMYVDTNLHTVLPARLNVRAGPSENHPVIGRLQRGQTIANLSVKGDWIEIPPPAGAIAYVAASLVNLPEQAQILPFTLLSNVPPVEPESPATNIVAVPTNPPVVVPLTEPVPPTLAVVPATNEVSATPAVTPVVPEAAPQTSPSIAIEPPKPRLVTREGLVSGMTSIQAPSYFKLENLETRRIMDYIRSPSTNLVLNRYVGRHVLIEGEEALDRRWPTVPVLTVQKILVVEE